MTDQQQITDAFMRDFEELLRRYNADFTVTEESRGPYCYEAVAEICFNGVYDSEGNTVRPYIDFTLPNYINPNQTN
jgi:hypothetical protein